MTIGILKTMASENRVFSFAQLHQKTRSTHFTKESAEDFLREFCHPNNQFS